MKNFKLILVRHASYGSGNNPGISEDGVKQAKRLAEKIKSEIGNGDVTIWTSTANRAKETALAVKSELPLVKDFEEYETLWSDNRHQYDFDWLKEKLKNTQIEGTLIIFSHLEYVRYFPRYLEQHTNDAEYAEGVVIHNGKCKLISWQ